MKGNPFANWTMAEVEAHNRRVLNGVKKRRSDVGAKRPRHFHQCKRCGATFHAPNSIKRKYCSLTCAYMSPERTAWAKPKDRGKRICKGCGIEFSVHTRSRNAVYCSKPCANKAIAAIYFKAKRTPRPRKAHVAHQCPICKKEFNAWKCSDRVYCSVRCGRIGNAGKAAATMRLNGTYLARNSYSRCASGWRTIGGKHIFARSSWEANYARYLQWQKERGEIIEWEHEPEVFWFTKIQRGCRSYCPDFRVTKTGGVEYHEVKGWMDKKSQTKIKRMAKYHPAIVLVVVDQHRYRVLHTTLKNVIPGWEARIRTATRNAPK